jgi:hypothetical protein
MSISYMGIVKGEELLVGVAGVVDVLEPMGGHEGLDLLDAVVDRALELDAQDAGCSVARDAVVPRVLEAPLGLLDDEVREVVPEEAGQVDDPDVPARQVEDRGPSRVLDVAGPRPSVGGVGTGRPEDRDAARWWALTVSC